MKKHEASFTILFRHYLMANPMPYSCAFELKDTRSNDSIPFSAAEDHQLDALLAVKWGKKGLLYKAPDDSRNIKPFDLFYLINSPGFIVIKYPSLFVIIDVETFVEEKKRSKRKSLTSSRAKEIAWRVVDLKTSYK